MKIDANGTKPITEIPLESLMKGWQQTMDRQEKEIKQLRETILLNKKVYDNLFEKGNINWGKTFGIDFGLLNEAMLATEKVCRLPWRADDSSV